jgi:hypothetical protein
MRLLFLLLISAILSNVTSAQNSFPLKPTTFDTLHAYVDDKHHTYFQYHSPEDHISRDITMQFRVRESEMLFADHSLTGDTIQQGRSVLIPFSAEALLENISYSMDCIAVTYTVRPKETLFKIARRYFDLKVDRLRQINHLSSNDISIGQKLVVGWFVLHPVTESVHSTEQVFEKAEPVDPFYPEVPKVQIGVAYWNKTAEGSSHLFAMHRSARINSLIEITNPMFKSKVLVKVVGRIPPTFQEDIALVVSPAVAKKLGVLDPRFRAEMRFVE